LKEFFRLKREEIKNFITNDWEKSILGLFIAYLLILVFIVFTTGISTLTIILLVPLVILVLWALGYFFYYVFVLSTKWIISNWQQAKENVKKRESK
nr:hypothetical protein [Nanoarchaeota archaeon]